MGQVTLMRFPDLVQRPKVTPSPPTEELTGAQRDSHCMLPHRT
jgi:hypothetical protein